MNKARAMLDALMGPQRDQKKDENAEDWKDKSICKGFLVGFCPFDKSVVGGKRSMDPCDKIHSEVIREKFDAHKDGQDGSELRNKYEEYSIRDLEFAIQEAEAYGRREVERLRKEPRSKALTADVNQKISQMKRESLQLEKKANALDDCDARKKEELMKQSREVEDEAKKYEKEEEEKVKANFRPLACEVCGTAYVSNEEGEYEAHLKYKVHEAYTEIHARLKELKDKKAERDRIAKEKKEEERKKRKEEEGKKAQAVELAEDIAAVLRPGLFGDWVLVDDSFPPLPIAEFQALKVWQYHKGLEDGYPDLPEECLRIAARALSCSPEETVNRAHNAYVQGFLARTALATDTPYLKDQAESEEGHQHWVIFYRKTPGINRRVTTKKCKDIAITVEDQPVWQGFKTVTELTIFCAGTGGILVAVPDRVLNSDALLDAMMREEAGVLGPSKEFAAQLMVEEDTASGAVGVIDLDRTATIQVLDLEDSVLAEMREYDPVTDAHEPIIPFVDDEPNALPKLAPLLPLVSEWIEAVALERLNFYSAREEQEAEPERPAPRKAAAKRPARATLTSLGSQLALMQQQIQAIAAQQEMMAQAASSLPGIATNAPELPNGPAVKVPSLSAQISSGTAPKTAALLVGAPPKTKASPLANAADAAPAATPIPCTSAPSGEPNVVSAIAQQSLAIIQLVTHLTSGDPMSDLAGGFSLGLNTKGVARRERMQNDLAQRTSTYFLQVQQQLFKRMNPARAVPRSQEELAQADVSMTTYLERYGGFRNNKDVGLTMWILAHAMDAAAQEDFRATKEYLALLTAALEQSALDGSWSVAYILSLMEEPPQQLFAERMQPMAAAGRPFAPLVPPAWAAVALSYLRELEVLNTRKTEVRRPPAQQPKAGAASSDSSPAPSPKRKPRFPKKPKASAENP
eukprot:s4028_g3.t1